MPTLCLSSPLLKTTADGLSLAVGITHQLKLAIDDEPVLKIQKLPPVESLDILSSSSILLRLTGSFGGKQISTETLRRSSLVAYFLEYLKFHAAQLFIANVSDPYVSADGTLEFAIASSRALLHPDELPVTTATLIAIDWSFSWKSNSMGDSFMNPFSSQHLLPVQNIVSSVVGKVLSRDFVRRYPLIFGSWRNSLGIEMGAFPQLVQPILNIIARSQNPAFQKQCGGLLRSLRRSNNALYNSSSDRLQDALGSLTLDDVPVSSCKNADDGHVLLVSLQRLYRTLFRAERFQASTFITKSDDTLCSSDHDIPSSDTLLEYDESTPFEDPGDPPLGSDGIVFTNLFTEPEFPQDTINMGTLPTTQFETLVPEEAADAGHLYADVFTLAGLDGDWESDDLQSNPTQRRKHSLLDDHDLGCMALDLDAPASPWFRDLVTLDHPMLDLDSDDEMGEGAVLDF